MSEPEEPKIHDARAWTGDVDAQVENYKKVLGGIKAIGGALVEASPVPVALGAATLAVGTLHPAAAVGVFIYAHYKRTEARMRAEGRATDIGSVSKESAGIFEREWREAGQKTGVEWNTRDKNADGVTDMREYAELMLDIAGNYMPGDKMIGPVLDGIESAASYYAIGEVAGAAKGAVATAVPTVTEFGKAAVGVAVSTPIVAGVMVPLSMHDENAVNAFFRTPLGAWIYDMAGFDGKFGPGGDDYAKSISANDSDIDPTDPTNPTAPGAAPQHGAGASIESRRQIDKGDLDIGDVTSVAPQDAYGDIVPDNEAPKGSRAVVTAANTRKKPGVRFGNTGGMD